jgi:hypothetical protein
MHYSIIPLFWHPRCWTRARLSNIPYYQAIPIITYVLTGNSLLLLLHLGCTTNQVSTPFRYLLHLLFHEHQISVLFFCGFSVSTRDAEGPEISGSGVYIAAEVDGVGEKGSGDTTTVHVQTLFETFVEAFQTWNFSSTAKVSGFSEY